MRSSSEFKVGFLTSVNNYNKNNNYYSHFRLWVNDDVDVSYAYACTYTFP